MLDRTMMKKAKRRTVTPLPNFKLVFLTIHEELEPENMRKIITVKGSIVPLEV
jgi:hypothetical protein